MNEPRQTTAGGWRVEPRSKPLAGSLLGTLGALGATVCAVLAIALIGVVATAAVLVLAPAAVLAVWGLGAIPVQGPQARK